MEEEPHISIGPDKWINWIDPGHGTQLFSLDEHMENIEPFWDLLEKHCVTSCCGIDALDFWPESIREAKDNVEYPGLRKEFEKLRSLVAERPEIQMSSNRLNHTFHRTVLLELLDHIISYL